MVGAVAGREVVGVVEGFAVVPVELGSVTLLDADGEELPGVLTPGVEAFCRGKQAAIPKHSRTIPKTAIHFFTKTPLYFRIIYFFHYTISCFDLQPPQPQFTKISIQDTKKQMPKHPLFIWLLISPRCASERSTRCRTRDGRTWAGREP